MAVYKLPGGATFELDEDGVGDILRSPEMSGLVREAANGLAAELGARGVEQVWVDRYVTDRAAASVTVPYDRDTEAKQGTLIDAATAVGLEVRSGRS